KLIVLIDRPTISPSELASTLGNRVEHRPQIQRRTYGLADLSKRRQFFDGACQISCPLLQLCKEPHVLDSDDRLVGEGLEQCDLLIGEGARFTARDREGTDAFTSPHHGDDEQTTIAKIVCQLSVAIRVPFGIRHMHDGSVKNRSARAELFIYWAR